MPLENATSVRANALVTTGYALASRNVRTTIPTPDKKLPEPNWGEEIDELPGYAQDIARAGRRSTSCRSAKIRRCS